MHFNQSRVIIKIIIHLRYLVGRRLVNYNHNQVRGGTDTNTASGATSS